jgi:serine/threonine protein phosphatase 1
VDGVALYAVGDVHGRADLLRDLLERIRDDARGFASGGPPILLFVGDYVDRGPDSRGVIDEILAEKKRDQFRMICLRGNHDAYLLNFLENGETGPMWMDVGAAATLLSYGVSPPRLRTDTSAWREASAQLQRAMPQDHLDLLASASLMANFRDYVFVHAGVRPGVALDQQTDEDLMTIRGKFLASDNPADGKVVVFGHTPFDQPYVRPRKIGIDTGAYSSGVLTALRIFEDQIGFIRSGAAGASGTARNLPAAAL